MKKNNILKNSNRFFDMMFFDTINDRSLLDHKPGDAACVTVKSHRYELNTNLIRL